jgi:hypothetical protein
MRSNILLLCSYMVPAYIIFLIFIFVMFFLEFHKYSVIGDPQRRRKDKSRMQIRKKPKLDKAEITRPIDLYL